MYIYLSSKKLQMRSKDYSDILGDLKSHTLNDASEQKLAMQDGGREIRNTYRPTSAAFALLLSRG